MAGYGRPMRGHGSLGRLGRHRETWLEVHRLDDVEASAIQS